MRVVADQRGVGAGEVEEPLELCAERCAVGGDLFTGLQRALAALAARVADQSRTTTDEDHRTVAGALQVQEPHDRDQAPHMETVGGGVEPAIASDRAGRKRVG